MSKLNSKLDELKLSYKYNTFRDAFIISITTIIILLFLTIMGITFDVDVYFSNMSSKLLAAAVLALLTVSGMLIGFSFRRYSEMKDAVYEKNRAERIKEKNKEQLEAVIDGVPDLIIQVDESLKILWANKTALEYNSNAIGMFAHDAFNYPRGSFIDSYCKWSIEALKIEKGIQNQSNVLGIKGFSYWEIIGVPLINKSKEVYGAIAIVRNITARMKTEHTWNLLSSVVESTNDAIFGVSLTGVILSWNKGAENTYGYTADEIIGENISRLCPAELLKDFLYRIEQVMRTETVYSLESIRYKKPGNEFRHNEIIISSTICPFIDATGRKVGVSFIDRDITESKLAQQALLESENFNRTIISSVKDAICVFDEKLTIKTWNDAMENITGINSENAIGKKFKDLDFRFTEEIEKSNAIAKALKGNTISFDNIAFQNTANSTIIWNNITFTPHINLNGDIIGVVAITRDVTESKLAQKALGESEEKYRQLVENASEAIISFASDSTILYANDVASQVLKLDLNDLIGKQASDFIDGDKKDKVLSTIQRLFNHGEKNVFDITVPIAETEKSFFVSAQPVKDSAGNTVSLLCLCTDITERKKAEQALFESESRFRQMANTINDAFWLSDWINNKLLYVSPAYEMIWGRKLSDIYSKPNAWLKGVHNDDVHHVKQSVLNLEDNENMDVIFRVIKPDKSLRWVNNLAYPVLDDSGKVYRVVGIARDITEQKLAEIELERSKEQLRKLAIHLESIREKERKDIAFEVHDELGQELTALKLDIFWMFNRLENPDIRIVEKMDDIKNLIDQTIDRVGSISTKLRPDILDHFGLVAAIEWYTNDFTKRSGIKCDVKFNPSDIIVEPEQATVIFRILQETLTNVIRHAHASKVDVLFSETMDDLVLTVSDNGIGASDKKINDPNAFGIFAIKERAMSVDGKVTFKGIPNVGTSVTLRIPLNQTSNEQS